MSTHGAREPAPGAVRVHPPAVLRLFEQPIESHRLSRRVVTTSDGRSWRILKAVPVASPPREGYPLLTMLDGNAAFEALTPRDLAEVPGLALAGIAHDTPLRFDVLGRSLDFTPPRGPDDPSPDPDRPERMIGGAERFRDLLTGELRDAVETGLPVDPRRRGLWGHSLAGLFTLYTLLTRPAAFGRYAAASPSVWWGGQWLLGLEERSALPPGLGAHILVMLGDSERRSSPTGPHWDGPAPHTLDLAGRLGRRPGLDVALRVFEGLGHAATLAASLPPALEFAAQPR